MKNFHLSVKVLLVLLSEVLAFWLTKLFSANIYPIQHTTISYIVCGALLGYFVVSVYNRFIVSRKKKIELELKTITDVALKRFDADKK